jgi:hypothetical protein
LNNRRGPGSFVRSTVEAGDTIKPSPQIQGGHRRPILGSFNADATSILDNADGSVSPSDRLVSLDV